MQLKTWVSATGLSLLAAGGLMSLALANASVNPGSELAAPTSMPASEPSQEESAVPPLSDEVELSIITEPLLPPLTDAEIEALLADAVTGISNWFGLAGLNKVRNPPPYSDELQAYYAAWSEVDPVLAAFLGFWHDEQDYAYSLSIFPSSTSEQVCILEFKPEWSLLIWNEATGEYGKDVITEPILSFSVATVQAGQLRSSQVRSVGSAITGTQFAVNEAYSVRLMSLLDEEHRVRTVAAASVPTLPPDLPPGIETAVLQALAAYGCTMERPNLPAMTPCLIEKLSLSLCSNNLDSSFPKKHPPIAKTKHKLKDMDLGRTIDSWQGILWGDRLSSGKRPALEQPFPSQVPD